MSDAPEEARWRGGHAAARQATALEWPPRVGALCQARERCASTMEPTLRNLAPGIRASLNSKLERMLARPIIAQIEGITAPAEDGDAADLPSAFRALRTAVLDFRAGGPGAWREDPDDGTCSIRIRIDYDDEWRGCEKEIRESVVSILEGSITLLTDPQKALLERSPREFLALSPRPETAELVSFETENVGGSLRVVELKLAAVPDARQHIRHVAIVPNLVQIERQLEALRLIENGADDGTLGPLRALVGLCDGSNLPVELPAPEAVRAEPGESLDEYQSECVRKSLATSHFAVIEGPPGSGKTTVITGIIRRALARGDRVLVVSPTHVAVDNVVEKLIATREDHLGAHSLPVRYAARPAKLSAKALDYWVGAKRQRRGAAIARRVQARLTASVPFANALFELEDTDAAGRAPLSSALASVESVVCGTPIGILSYLPVKSASAGSFDLLIVDEVSKMTMSEFLAIAVKARRWVVVGDPAQLPPYNNSEENGATLDDIVPPIVELACSVAAILDRIRPAFRRDERIVVVSSAPELAAKAICSHLDTVMPGGAPTVGPLDSGAGIVACSPADLEPACNALASATGTVRVLVESGLTVARPAVASGRRLVERRERAHAAIFEGAFNVYHAQPWATASGQRIPLLEFRGGLEKCLPSPAALKLVDGALDREVDRHQAVTQAISGRFALNTISVYDWLTGIPASDFDTSPLRELGLLSSPALRDAVKPFVGTLKRQYRMHSSLSFVPRELFYFGHALLDGRADEAPGCRVVLAQVEGDAANRETNLEEANAICDLITHLGRDATARERPPEVMVITAYRAQEALLTETLARIEGRNIEVCTLDRCQGREAEYVLISLVRSRATNFFDMPKRWNVALTRAQQGLFIVGNVNAYLREAAEARRELNGRSANRSGRPRPGETRPRMSVLARVLEAYDRQVVASTRRQIAGGAG